MSFRDISFQQTDRQRALQNRGLSQIQSGLQGFANISTDRQKALAAANRREEDVGFRKDQLEETVRANKEREKISRGKKEGKLTQAQKHQQQLKKEERGVAREIAKEGRLFDRSARKELTQRRVKHASQTKGINRVLGNIDVLEEKFIKNPDNFTASDTFQFVRSIVPLAEVNPGVVRGEEFETARNLGGKLNGLSVQLENLTVGTLLHKQVIGEMFETAKLLKEAKNRNDEEVFGNISAEAEALGLDKKTTGLILGSSGREAMERFIARSSPDKEPAGNLVSQNNIPPGLRPVEIPGGAAERSVNPLVPEAIAGQPTVDQSQGLSFPQFTLDQKLQRRQELLNKGAQ